jgi:hypothetical protein
MNETGYNTNEVVLRLVELGVQSSDDLSDSVERFIKRAYPPHGDDVVDDFVVAVARVHSHFPVASGVFELFLTSAPELYRFNSGNVVGRWIERGFSLASEGEWDISEPKEFSGGLDGREGQAVSLSTKGLAIARDYFGLKDIGIEELTRIYTRDIETLQLRSKNSKRTSWLAAGLAGLAIGAGGIAVYLDDKLSKTFYGRLKTAASEDDASELGAVVSEFNLAFGDPFVKADGTPARAETYHGNGGKPDCREAVEWYAKKLVGDLGADDTGTREWVANTIMPMCFNIDESQPNIVFSTDSPRDSDLDGVYDTHDICPDTISYRSVDNDGCSSSQRQTLNVNTHF